MRTDKTYIRIFVTLIFSIVCFSSLMAQKSILEKHAVKKILMPQKAIEAKVIGKRSVLLKKSKKDATDNSQQAEKMDYKGQTFSQVPFDESLGMQNFNRKKAQQYFDKNLFSRPGHTASWYYAKLDEEAIDVEINYVQVVSDQSWNRLLYGALNSTIKSYDDITRPGEIVINSAGTVFVTETAKNRIQVLQISGSDENVSLTHLYNIEKISEPTSMDYHDNGTPLDIADDYLFVADAAENVILKFKLNSNSAEKIAEYKGFKWPVSIALGHWDGANNDLIYVLDNYAKNLAVYRESDSGFEKITTVRAENNQTFSRVKTDYFGQVYLAETVNSELIKYTADLEYLDGVKAPLNKALNDISIPFGTVEIKGEGTYWTGFDQLFAVQNWTDQSGVQRYKLGLAISPLETELIADKNHISVKYRMTDFARLKYSVMQDGKEIYRSAEIWQTSGDNKISWNRKSNDNEQVPSGTYQIEVQAASAYGDDALIEKSRFYLPAYYHIACGAEDNTKAFTAIRGEQKTLHNNSWREDEQYVSYQFTGLNPDAQYEIAVNFYAPAGEEVIQELKVDNTVLGSPVAVSGQSYKTRYFEIDKDALVDGQIIVDVNKISGSKAAVADIWLKETGSEFRVFDINEIIPTDTKLIQNYPNPFNPQTTISYNISKTTSVELTVFDMLGRKVRMLVNKSSQQPGKYSIVFDGNGLSSGVYFYRLKAGQTVEIRKMILLQ